MDNEKILKFRLAVKYAPM